MTTLATPMAPPNLRKRPFNHIEVPLDGSSSHEDTEHSERHHERQSRHRKVQRSPDLRDAQLLERIQPADPSESHSRLAASVGPAVEGLSDPVAPGTSSGKPASRTRRSTAAEQEARRKEKEIKDLQRADEKAKRDGEKEEKRKAREAQGKAKEEERIQREKAREAQIRAKEDEKRKKEEEMIKKQKSQLRLSSFFVQTSTTDAPRTNCHSPKSSPRSSISTTNDGVNSRSRSASPKPSQTQQSSEYERSFPPFYVHMHTTLAPETQFSRDEGGLKSVRNMIDEQLQASEDSKLSIGAFNPFQLLHLPSQKQSNRGWQRNSVKDLLARIHGTSQNPIDLTGSRSNAVDRPLDLLAAIPVKYLRFAEDVRPPYIGTYTKVSDPQVCSKLRRNPFTRSLPTNYEYDSEAEWEEPGEGEDLESEGEEEVGEDDEEDEMEGFLDDEEVGDGNRMVNLKRRLVVSDLEPVSIGLCWETSQHERHSNKDDQGLDLEPFRLEMVSETYELPIDPHSAVYWQPKPRDISKAPWVIHTPMDPPRIPLTSINRSNNLKSAPSNLPAPKLSVVRTETLMPAQLSRAPKRLIAVDILEAFKHVVAGSDLTKTGLVEVLKKHFPKEPKDAIKDTLGLIAERVGNRESEKRWIIKAAYATVPS